MSFSDHEAKLISLYTFHKSIQKMDREAEITELLLLQNFCYRVCFIQHFLYGSSLGRLLLSPYLSPIEFRQRSHDAGTF